MGNSAGAQNRSTHLIQVEVQHVWHNVSQRQLALAVTFGFFIVAT
jgi:hypothetical protein